ncbi:hypothetical protein LCGC14_0974890 [marine sediment metagenome]|uniref:Uncharacterized protein n=1 Tax=marine sediment metagenome TaxID=412755 RepID=A0A0F9RGY7_9ZZZZ
MTIDLKNPKSYGEHMGAMQLEASKALAESEEKSLKPFIPNIFTDPDIRASMPFDFLGKFESLLEFPDPGLAGVGGRFVSEVADSAVSMIMNPALRKTQYAANRLFDNLVVTADTATMLWQRKWITDGAMDYRFRSAGYNADEQQMIIAAAHPFPTLPEWLRWARYHGSPENTWTTLEKKIKIDPRIYQEWDWLSQQQLGTDQITGLYRREKLIESQADELLMQTGWSRSNSATIRELSFVVPNAMLLLQGGLVAERSTTDLLKDLGKGDIHPDYRQTYFDAVMTKPASSDLVQFHLRKENDLRDLPKDLTRIGIHPEFLDIYKTLADRIPPLPDIITMAVREAFSPATAARFGQYEDFPRDFAKYAAQQGLSEEWAKRYWAAHWGLPSITQGFDMLHRGIIDIGDLNMLLKAADVMPFWRDRLIAMAYHPLTRVDVRRMFKLGVLTLSQVHEAFLQLGYSPENATNMTEFTAAQILEERAGLTTAEVIKAYVDRLVDKQASVDLLIMLNVDPDQAVYLIDTEDIKRDWFLTSNKIKAIRNLYKRGEYDVNTARDELSKLNQPAEQIDVLMEQWWYEKKEDGGATWSKAETFRFARNDLITQDRAKQEFQAMGYDAEHIEVYMKAI